jgi:hypothetical protein
MNSIVSTASLASAVALPAALPASAQPHTDADLLAQRARLEALWVQRTDLALELRKTYAALSDAEAKMPEWARPGPTYLRSDGSYFGEVSNWPRIEDATRPEGIAFTNVRPSPADLEKNFGFRGWSKQSRQEFEDAMSALNEHLARQEAERAKLGIPELESAAERLVDRICDMNEEIEAAPQPSPTKAAAMFMIGMTRARLSDTLDNRDMQYAMANGTLPLIRPHLSGLIADHIDDLIEHPEKTHSERVFW